MTAIDRFGRPHHGSTDAIAAYSTALEAVLALDADAWRLLDEMVEVDPGLPVGRALRWFAARRLGAPFQPPKEWQAIDDRRLATATSCDRSAISLLRDLVGKPDGSALIDRFRKHLAAWPDDLLIGLVAVSVTGTAPAAATDIVEWRAAQPAPLDWFWTGCLAMSRQAQGRFDDAGRLAASALATQPSAARAAHALMHVHYETAQHTTGAAWLREWIDTHPVLFFQTHFPWHLAQHELALDDLAGVRAIARDQLCRGSSIDRGSLLWRCRLYGVLEDLYAAQVDQDLDTVMNTDLPCEALGAGLLAAATDDEPSLRNLVDRCLASTSEVHRDVVAPILAGIQHALHRDAATAADLLASAVPQLPRVGSSAAQRDVVEDTLVIALRDAGRGRETAELLRTRLGRRPSRWDQDLLTGLCTPP
jgi:hypothetical protein